MRRESTATTSQPPTAAPGRAAAYSVLFPAGHPRRETREVPDCFRDLLLNLVEEAVTRDWKDYDLAPFFRAPLHDPDAIAYRQEVMRELEQEPVMQSIAAFTRDMRTMRSYLELSRKLYYEVEKDRWFLRAAEVYCDCVARLHDALAPMTLQSRGLTSFRALLSEYVSVPAFARLAASTAKLVADLGQVRYLVRLRDLAVTVLPYEEATDYTAAVEAAFEKFRRGAVKEYRMKFADRTGMNHVEAQIAERVTLLYPEPFLALKQFRAERAEFCDPLLSAFDREIHFYLAWLDYAAPLRRAGLPFCFPALTRGKDVFAADAFDIALAHKLVGEDAPVVPNGFFLRGPERVLVVSGPNQGGKTTFARAFGQLHYLASLGCSVPGVQARLLLFDRLFCHFEQEEHVANLRGKLEDDLVRLHEILEQATSASVLILNELFSSTTIADAVYLGRKVMARLCGLDALCVWVTFLDELAAFSEHTVSMVGVVDPRDPAARTFRIERRPADGMAYALAIAEKHRVTYERIRERIKV